jgi:hypothetical protein
MDTETADAPMAPSNQDVSGSSGKRVCTEGATEDVQRKATKTNGQAPSRAIVPDDSDDSDDD